MPQSSQVQSRGQILSVPRWGPAAAEEITAELDATATAGRVRRAALERDGLLARDGLGRRTRPSVVYRVSAAGEPRSSDPAGKLAAPQADASREVA